MTTSSLPCAPFEATAALYDRIHAGKNYARDIEQILSIVGEQPQLPAGKRRVTDWGAGTGEHVRRWPAYGWQAIGVDPSPAMVKIAQQKAIDVRTGSICGSVEIGREAFIQTCLFASFSYAIQSVAQLESALKNVRYHAARGGYFILDCVNYSACIGSLRKQQITDLRGFTRTINKRFNPLDSVLDCQIEYRFHEMGRPRKVETHILRAFTPREITDALTRHGFDVLRVYDPESPKMKPPTADSYYFAVAARLG